MRQKPFSRASLLILSVCLLALTVSFLSYFLWESRSRIESGAAADAEKMDKLLERYLYTTLHETDLALAASAGEYRRLKASSRSPDAEFNRVLARATENLPQVATIRGVDARGSITHYGKDEGRASITIADREHFLRTRDGDGSSGDGERGGCSDYPGRNGTSFPAQGEYAGWHRRWP